MIGYWIVMANIGGILEKKFVPKDENFDEDSLRKATVEMINSAGMLEDGDRFVIEEGEQDKAPCLLGPARLVF